MYAGPYFAYLFNVSSVTSLKYNRILKHVRFSTVRNVNIALQQFK